MDRISGYLAAILAAAALAMTGCASAGDCASPTDRYDLVWDAQSTGSDGTMPCGGGDVGLNVWVENGQLLFYIARSGAFDENNTMLKLGRVRVVFGEPLDAVDFSQVLHLDDGSVNIRAGKDGSRTDIRLWVDVFKPVVHMDIKSASAQPVSVFYESWRYEDRQLRRNESFQNSYKWAPPRGLKMLADHFEAGDGGICFWHQNGDYTMTDVVTEQQELSDVRDGFFDPLRGLVSGGRMSAPGFRFAGTSEGVYTGTPYRAWRFDGRPASSHHVTIGLHISQQLPEDWHRSLDALMKSVHHRRDSRASAEWWRELWQRSFIDIFPDGPSAAGGGSVTAQEREQAWKVGRNYQLFRYQLACNAYSDWPTKFNGGLFTSDPVYVNPDRPFSPDFRNWGGGTFTAQNQRLVYFPMLKSGDTDMVRPQMEFYRRLMHAADWRTRHYWGHPGASYTEQIENFGLPNPSEYGWDRPEGYDPGMEYNKWLEYQWDTALEFCHLGFEAESYGDFDMSSYISMVESVLTFFDEHYRYLARLRGETELDGDGHLRLYPGSACETYKITDNSTSTIAALDCVAGELAAWHERAGNQDRAQRWSRFRGTLPEISFRGLETPEGGTVQGIAPAKSWERINNSEAPQLYPVWPWRMYGPLSEDLDLARNTYLYDPDVREFYTWTGWKQYNIFAACLGMTDEAKALTLKKFEDATAQRFPTFWGPGYDWTPDHNWGGTAMIGLQEMLLQTDGDRILLFPAWPREWDVHFKLHAPGKTTVEAELRGGEVRILGVTPEGRLNDIVNMFENQ